MSISEKKKDTWEGHVYQLSNRKTFHAVVSYNDLYGFEFPLGTPGGGTYDTPTEALRAAKAYADLLQEIGQNDRSEGNMVPKDSLPKGAFVEIPSVRQALKAVAIRGSGKKKLGPKSVKKQGPKGPKAG